MTTPTLDIPRGKKARPEAPPPAPATTSAPPIVQMLPIEKVALGPNVRTQPGPDDVADLTVSIGELGVLVPIKVKREPDGWQVIWGQRRLVAAKLAGLTEIPAITIDDDRAAAAVAIEQLTENLQRADLNPIDEAKALRRILDETPGLAQGELARGLGRSESWLSNSLRLLGLDERVQAKIETGELSQSHGKAIASLPAKQQREMVEEITRDGASSKDVERQLEWKRQAAETAEQSAARTAKALPKAIAALEAAGVPKDAPVYVKAYGFDKLEPGIRKAGYSTSDEHIADAPAEGCDCSAFVLELDGRKAKVKAGCISDHWRRAHDREQNANRQAQAAAEKERKALVDQLRRAVEASLTANPVAPAIIRLITFQTDRSGGRWSTEGWAEYARLDAANLTAKLVEQLTGEYRLREIPIEEVVAELTGTVPGQTSIDDAPPAAEPIDLAAAALEAFGDDVESVTDEGPAPAITPGRIGSADRPTEGIPVADAPKSHLIVTAEPEVVPITPAPKPAKGKRR